MLQTQHSPRTELRTLPWLRVAPYVPRFEWYERRGVDPILPERVYRVVKRAVDIVLAATLLPAVILIIGISCIAIRLETPGPALLRQVRTGIGGRRFKMFKLRTMVQNADQLKASLMHLNELTAPDFKIKNDPRVTSVGRILRKTSIDEVPQFINVLLGDMTLIGPRPTSFSASTYKLWHTARLQIKPGISGLSQVSGRNGLDFNDRLRLDLAYLQNRCLWLDLRLLALTVVKVFNGHGAY